MITEKKELYEDLAFIYLRGSTGKDAIHKLWNDFHSGSIPKVIRKGFTDKQLAKEIAIFCLALTRDDRAMNTVVNPIPEE